MREKEYELLDDLEWLRSESFAVSAEHGWHDKSITNDMRLATILSEIGELINADRADRHALSIGALLERIDIGEADAIHMSPELYKTAYEDTVESELADIILRCFDYLSANDRSIIFDNGLNFTYTAVRRDIEGMEVYELALFLDSYLSHPRAFLPTNTLSLSRIIGAAVAWSESHEIDILTHIRLKIEYNKSRPFKHGGKKY